MRSAHVPCNSGTLQAPIESPLFSRRSVSNILIYVLYFRVMAKDTIERDGRGPKADFDDEQRLGDNYDIY